MGSPDLRSEAKQKRSELGFIRVVLRLVGTEGAPGFRGGKPEIRLRERVWFPVFGNTTGRNEVVENYTSHIPRMRALISCSR